MLVNESSMQEEHLSYMLNDRCVTYLEEKAVQVEEKSVNINGMSFMHLRDIKRPT